MYEFTDRVRYSETDENNEMKVTAMVNYLQDCSTFHSAEVGLGIEKLAEMKRAWFLSYWDIYVDRLPRLCERIRIGTSPHRFKGIMANRNFWIKDEEDRFILRADSIWFSMDTEKMRPCRISDDMVSPFGAPEDVLGLPESQRRIELPDILDAMPEIRVQRHHIDSNHHVNNAKYIEMASEVLMSYFHENKRWSGGRIRAEYKKAAVLNDELFPKVGKAEDAVVVSLQSREGEVYANVEIR